VDLRISRSQEVPQGASTQFSGVLAAASAVRCVRLVFFLLFFFFNQRERRKKGFADPMATPGNRHSPLNTLNGGATGALEKKSECGAF
jgi:hypothetical protein